MRSSFESDQETAPSLASSIVIEDSDEEQARGLLENDEEVLHDGYEPGHVRSHRWEWFVAVVVLVALGSVTFASIFFANRQTTEQTIEAIEVVDGSPSRPNDYILDTDWDFDAEPTRREFDFEITDQIANPDGVYRPMILINNQFPGPLIEVNEHDTIVVNVHNRAANATSIHWHGIYHKGSNWFDGTIGVTQCPVAPGTNFTYEFKVGGQSGTYWYHAHMGVQTSDGLLGPLIIHSEQEKELQKIEYATDRVVMVQDYYHDLSDGLLLKYLEPDRENAEPVPDGALINGQNVRNCSTLPNRKCDTENATLPIFDLAPNENHRLRFINVGAFAEFQIQIDEHEFAVTEVDGTDVWPEYYHRLNINPAQRYSIVVTANNTDAESFWLRARMVTHCFAEPNPELEPEVRAIVRYQNATSSLTTPALALQSPSSRDWPEVIEMECHDLNTTELHPVIPLAAPSKPNASIYIRSNFEIGAHRLSRGFFNSSSFRPNFQSPLLSRLISGMESTDSSSFATLSEPNNPTGFSLFAPQPFPSLQNGIGINTLAYDPSHELVLQTPQSNSVVDLIFTNFDDGAHPLHLHGHKFFVLGSGAGYPPSNIVNLASANDEESSAAGIDLSNPLRRDTATIPSYSWLHLRVVLDNPGAWLLHCHVAWHFEAGMGMVVAVGTDDIKDQIGRGEGGWGEAMERMGGMCALPGIERGGRPGDETWDNA